MSRLLRPRHLLALAALVAGAALADPVARGDAGVAGPLADPAMQADLSVLTYNVKGLPWPVATGRDRSLKAIAARLAALRREGRQPQVVVLQEAFTDQAREIAARAGYAWHAQGPYARTAPGVSAQAGGQWHLGEPAPALLDSGLAILSDYPVTSVVRAPFSQGACAGFNCLAAKGVLLVTLAVPGRGEVAVAATHLNSRKASGADYERTHAAYARQVAFLEAFLAKHRRAEVPLVLAGDFNRGQRPARIAALGAAQERLGLSDAVEALGSPLGTPGERHFITSRARDMQFTAAGEARALEPSGGWVPFGREPDGAMLSDHMGFAVAYRIAARQPAT